MKKNYLFTFVFTLLFSFSYSATYYVSTAANGGVDDGAVTGSVTSPWATLSYAISRASSGDTIIVGPGTFTSDCNIAANKNLTIEGHGRDLTIFDGSSGNAGCGFMAITADVTIKSMTIKGYTTTQDDGFDRTNTAGILIGGARGDENTNSSPLTVVIQNIKFYDIYNAHASSSTYGSAISTVRNFNASNHSLTVSECIFFDNYSDGYGGAVHITDGVTASFNNCLFMQNTSGGGGAAIFFSDYSDSSGEGILRIYNCTIYGNYAQASYSGGILTYTSSNSNFLHVDVRNSFLAYNSRNTAAWGHFNYYDDIQDYSRDGAIVWNIDQSIIRDNSIFLSNGFSNLGGNVNDNIDAFSQGKDNADYDYDDLGIAFDDGKRMTWATTAHTTSDLRDNGTSTPTSIDINGVPRPQGSAADIGAFEYANTWLGGGTNDFHLAANWTLNQIPGSNPAYNAVRIEDGTTDPVITEDVELSVMKIRNGAAVTIAQNGSLKLTDNLINNGTLTMQSASNEFSSLIVEGSSYGEVKHQYNGGSFGDVGSYTGNITYKRFVADEALSGGSGEWDYIGSPVDGQDLQSFITMHLTGSNSGTLAEHNGSVGIAPYNNSAAGGDADTSNFYTYYEDDNGSGDLISGKGYLMATDNNHSPGTTMDFTGTVITGDHYYSVTDASSSNSNYGKFNLVSNPYPSYLKGNSRLDGTNNFLTINGSTNDNLHDTYAGIYVYDGNGTISTKTNANTTAEDLYIAPGQGFFVAADESTKIVFTEAMQTYLGADDFNGQNSNMQGNEVRLKLFNGDNMIESTEIFFIEGLTNGLDITWDGGNFNADAALMTRLIEGDEGYGMAINAMGLDAMDNAVIPLVINQSAGQEFRVNLHSATIPDPNVYLEDVEEGTFTNLYEEDFVLTPTSDLEGVGRFFIHMSADTMSNEEVSTSMLNAYKEVNANYITLEGLATQSNNINVSLYNILGRKVLDTSLSNNMNTQTISTLGMAAGIYVIELESGTDRLTKKLIIQ